MLDSNSINAQYKQNSAYYNSFFKHSENCRRKDVLEVKVASSDESPIQQTSSDESPIQQTSSDESLIQQHRPRTLSDARYHK